MKGDIDLRDIKLKKPKLSRRSLIALATLVFTTAACVVTWRYLTHPPRPWLVRWKLDRYLKHEAHTGNFKVDFAFPPKSEMGKPKTAPAEAPLKLGSRTGKTFDALREEYLSQKTAAVTLERVVVRSESQLRESMAQLDALSKPCGAQRTRTPRMRKPPLADAYCHVAESFLTPARVPGERSKRWRPLKMTCGSFNAVLPKTAAASQAAGNAALAKARAAV